MDTQAKSAVTLARDAKYLIAALELDSKAQAVYVRLTDLPGVLARLWQALRSWRWYHRRADDNASRPLTAVMREIVELHAIGDIKPHCLRAIPKALDELIDELDVGVGRVSIDQLDEEDDEVEALGNTCFTHRRVRGASSVELRAEAKHHRRDAEVSAQLARALEREADKRDRDAGTFTRPLEVSVACAR